MGEHVPVQSAASDRAVIRNETTVGRSEPTSWPSLPGNTLIDYIFDRRGNPVYRRSPDGEVIPTEQIGRERIRINGRSMDRVLRRRRPEIDNDLPSIAEKYREFRQRCPIAGRAGRGRA